NDTINLFMVSSSATASAFLIPILITIMMEEINDTICRAYMIFLCLFILSFHVFAIFNFISSSILTQILAASSFAAVIVDIFIWSIKIDNKNIEAVAEDETVKSFTISLTLTNINNKVAMEDIIKNVNEPKRNKQATLSDKSSDANIF
ncbi:23609_t:CDS:2, partial [Racocetra persica]